MGNARVVLTAPPMSTVEKPRLQFLESIRGVAALVVVFYHFSLGFWPYMDEPASPLMPHVRRVFRFVARSPLDFWYHGAFAVVVFFVLSGFVLSYSFLRSPRHETLTSAALRRYLRLAVPVTTSVLLSYGLMRLHLNRNAEAAAVGHSDWLGAWGGFRPSLLANGPTGALRQGLYGCFFHLETSYNNVLWTMSVELPCSLLVFAFLALFGTVRNRWLVYAVAAAVLVWAVTDPSYFDFLVGIVLCDLYVRFEVRRRVFDLGWFAWPLLLLGCLLGGYNGSPALPWLTRWVAVRHVWTAGAAVVIGVPLFSTRVQRVMSSRPLAWLGRISFGLYLVHVLALLSVGSAVYLRLRQHAHWGHNSAALVASAAGIAVALAGGWGMYYVADLPSIAVGKGLANVIFMPGRVRRSPPSDESSSGGTSGLAVGSAE